MPNLILYHTEDRNLADRKRLYTEEGREYYSGNLFVPEDLETFEIYAVMHRRAVADTRRQSFLQIFLTHAMKLCIVYDIS